MLITGELYVDSQLLSVSDLLIVGDFSGFCSFFLENTDRHDLNEIMLTETPQNAYKMIGYLHFIYFVYSMYIQLNTTWIFIEYRNMVKRIFYC